MSAPAFFRSVFVSVLLLCAPLHAAYAQDAKLQLRVGSQQQTLALTDLLKHPALRTISIPADVSYKRAMQYLSLIHI